MTDINQIVKQCQKLRITITVAFVLPSEFLIGQL